MFLLAKETKRESSVGLFYCFNTLRLHTRYSPTSLLTLTVSLTERVRVVVIGKYIGGYL